MTARRQYDDPPEPDPSERGPHRLRPTGVGVVVGSALVGLVLGWLVRPTALRLDLLVPRVSWLQVVALYLVALVLLGVARATRTAVRERRLLHAYQAVNRLVLARACAVAAAVFAGGYLGYALSWVGIASELAGERIARSLVAALGAGAAVAAALLLERACRVREDDDAP